MNWTLIGLLGRMVLINVVPFILVFHMAVKHRRQLGGAKYSEIVLISGEIQTIGVIGYFVILSIYFFSIPVLRYAQSTGVDVLLVEPDGLTVFLIAFTSFYLVVASIYLRLKRKWAHKSLLVVMFLLLVQSFFSILEYGLFSIVPVVVFSYLFYRLRRPGLVKELKESV